MSDDISDLHFTPMGHDQVRAVRTIAEDAAGLEVTDEWGELERLARAATPGPWEAPAREDSRYGQVVSVNPAALEEFLKRDPQYGHSSVVAYGGALVGESMQKADREYVAAANPAKMIALLVLLTLYRAQRDDYKAQFEFQCRQRGIGEKREHDLERLANEMQTMYSELAAAVDRHIEDPGKPSPCAPLAKVAEAARELLADDDMPVHWTDCVCSYCVRYRALVYALADVDGPA